MIPSAFAYHRPGDLAAAIGLLVEHGDEARVIAGGHSLVPMMKLRMASVGHLVDLQAVAELKGIALEGGCVTIGAMVTLRGERMYEFLDRIISIVLPRVRDFRGVSRTAFDGHGNYSMGLNEWLVFPELTNDKYAKAQGLNITIVTTARENDHGRRLLEMFGMPFRAPKKKSA